MTSRIAIAVDLLAFVGLQSLGAANLLTAASRMIGAGPAVTLPIFDGGRLRANLAGTDADYDIAVEQYNQVVADAMREVVDQLASYQSLEEQRIQQRAALATAREAYDLALLRYREGLGNYLQVLSAEQPLHAQQSLDADLHARGLELAINLARALGRRLRSAAGARQCQPEMKDATMATPLLMTCTGSHAACVARRERRAEHTKLTKPTLLTRLSTLALALAALYAVFSGERWLLERPPATTNELVVATCVVDVVFGDAVPASACTSAGPSHEKEKAR